MAFEDFGSLTVFQASFGFCDVKCNPWETIKFLSSISSRNGHY